METVPEYCHTDAWERLQFQRATFYIPRVSYVQTQLKNDTEQNRTNHRTIYNLINKHAGFRPHIRSQLLNIIQNILDDYQENMITGIACVYLSTTKDTVNQRLLIM